MANAGPAARWPAVFSLTLGVFGLVTAEFLPPSLLTAMAADLGVSEGAAGQTVTATAVVAAIAGPSLSVLTGRIDRRLVMLGLTVLLVLSNAMAVWASDLWTLLAARVVLGVALGGFWSMAGPPAMRLVPEAWFARAMALVLSGVSLATVCAAPVGAWMGDTWGWRSAFIAAGVLGLVTLAPQWLTLPELPARGTADLHTLVRLLGRPPVRAVLLGYGIAGFFGTLAGGHVAGRSERMAVVLGSASIAVLAAAMLVAGHWAALTSVAIVLWGFAFAAFPVAFQVWIMRAAPDQAEAANGLVVAAFQVAIASGAIGGGVLVDSIGALGGPLFALVAMSLGAALTLKFGPRGGSPVAVAPGH
ncbi:MFS transporter [Pseudoxanthomonas sp. SGNA-20]|nr:MFS transporter [Pseudoxanthomonas sp. SGNA-20]